MISPECSVSTFIPIRSPDRDVSDPKTCVMVIFLNVIPFRAGVATRTISASGQPGNLPLHGRTRTLFAGKAA